ncbi:hypothetical protein V0M98_36155 (plasmid) [Pseudomonas silesiensis]|uniref:hypothetical protein n=1 Tax=Pseudomonas silesiensis TaxID=1853130 RepID=UPI0030CAA840
METDFSIGVKRLTEITACQKCGNNEIVEKRSWQRHSNGHWNESIGFACGVRYDFSPNFMEVGLAKVCTYDPEFKARKLLTAAVKEEIFKLAEQRGIHPEEMKRLRDKLQYWHPSDW